LTHNQEVATGFLNRSIHRALFVCENSQPGDLTGKPFDILAGIGGFDAQQNEQPAADLANDLSVDGDGGASDALDDCAHGIDVMARRPGSSSMNVAEPKVA